MCVCRRYKGRARKAYCQLTSLTPEYVQMADLTQLRLAFENLNLLETTGPLPASSGAQLEFLRKVLLRYLDPE